MVKKKDKQWSTNNVYSYTERIKYKRRINDMYMDVRSKTDTFYKLGNEHLLAKLEWDSVHGKNDCNLIHKLLHSCETFQGKYNIGLKEVINRETSILFKPSSSWRLIRFCITRRIESRGRTFLTGSSPQVSRSPSKT